MKFPPTCCQFKLNSTNNIPSRYRLFNAWNYLHLAILISVVASIVTVRIMGSALNNRMGIPSLMSTAITATTALAITAIGIFVDIALLISNIAISVEIIINDSRYIEDSSKTIEISSERHVNDAL